MNYDDMTKKCFLDEQLKLYPCEVAYDMEGAEEFLTEMDARVFDKKEELLDYMDRLGMDVSDLAGDDVLDQPEVFVLPDKRLLYVEG